MARGGARPNSGPKRTRPPVKRRLMLELSESEARCIAHLRLILGASRGTTEPLDAAAVCRYSLWHMLGSLSGYCIRHLDGDPNNVDLANLRLERLPR